jgi:hypothetical protein
LADPDTKNSMPVRRPVRNALFRGDSLRLRDLQTSTLIRCCVVGLSSLAKCRVVPRRGFLRAVCRDPRVAYLCGICFRLSRSVLFWVTRVELPQPAKPPWSAIQGQSTEPEYGNIDKDDSQDRIVLPCSYEVTAPFCCIGQAILIALDVDLASRKRGKNNNVE